MGYASTAGFESICEAMYLGKPILMVPVESQYEQACNAIDAVRSGAGVTARHFHLSELLACISTFRPKQKEFREWVSQGEQRILQAVTNL